jgi:hypothetical protein
MLELLGATSKFQLDTYIPTSDIIFFPTAPGSIIIEEL